VARVLVIDHEATFGELIRIVLSDEFEVTRTTNAWHALKGLLSGDWYDVILCDLEMPAIGGLELHNRVQAANRDLASRIVFVTGGSGVSPEIESLPNTILAKPFDFDALRELVRRRTGTPPPPRQATRY